MKFFAFIALSIVFFQNSHAQLFPFAFRSKNPVAVSNTCTAPGSLYTTTTTGTVPEFCNLASVDVWGAGGGASTPVNYDAASYLSGGGGGYAFDIILLPASGSYTAIVGGPGGSTSGIMNHASTAVGGTHGGGNGGSLGYWNNASAGGGYSALEYNSFKFIIAGGGGGSGCHDGTNNSTNAWGGPGNGGTGGGTGVVKVAGNAGSSLTGGAGANIANDYVDNCPGGGGGGGYIGGAGGGTVSGNASYGGNGGTSFTSTSNGTATSGTRDTPGNTTKSTYASNAGRGAKLYSPQAFGFPADTTANPGEVYITWSYVFGLVSSAPISANASSVTVTFSDLADTAKALNTANWGLSCLSGTARTISSVTNSGNTYTINFSGPSGTTCTLTASTSITTASSGSVIVSNQALSSSYNTKSW